MRHGCEKLGSGVGPMVLGTLGFAQKELKHMKERQRNGVGGICARWGGGGIHEVTSDLIDYIVVLFYCRCFLF